VPRLVLCVECYLCCRWSDRSARDCSKLRIEDRGQCLAITHLYSVGKRSKDALGYFGEIFESHTQIGLTSEEGSRILP
jgi:hypothetical protein